MLSCNWASVQNLANPMEHSKGYISMKEYLTGEFLILIIVTYLLYLRIRPRDWLQSW